MWTYLLPSALRFLPGHFDQYDYLSAQYFRAFRGSLVRGRRAIRSDTYRYRLAKAAKSEDT